MTTLDQFQPENAALVAEITNAQATIAQYVEAIHAETDPARRQEYALALTEWANYGTGLAQQAANLTDSAVAVAKEFQTQRDAALDELSKLVNAVQHIDINNPLVYDLVEAVEEDIVEQVETYAMDMASDSAHEEIFTALTEDIMGTLEVDWQTADRFLDLIRGQYTPMAFRSDPSPTAVVSAFIERLEARRDHLAALRHPFMSPPAPDGEDWDESEDDDEDE